MLRISATSANNIINSLVMINRRLINLCARMIRQTMGHTPGEFVIGIFLDLHPAPDLQLHYYAEWHGRRRPIHVHFLDHGVDTHASLNRATKKPKLLLRCKAAVTADQPAHVCLSRPWYIYITPGTCLQRLLHSTSKTETAVVRVGPDNVHPGFGAVLINLSKKLHNIENPGALRRCIQLDTLGVGAKCCNSLKSLQQCCCWRRTLLITIPSQGRCAQVTIGGL